ncbi:MAG: ABC transporter substrate-binding protein [Myxococcota bacterium]|nr:ABC transporter substrate-binding protein [Myxococcota bacterium]
MSRSSSPNGLLIGGLGVILAATLYNTLQINNAEKLAIENQERLDEILKNGVRTSGGGAASAGLGGGMVNNASLMGPGCLTDQAKADLADPKNLLTQPTQCRAKGEHYRGGTLRSVLSSDPRGLNPYIANGADVTEYGLLMNDYMAERDINNPDVWIPRLATSVTTEDEGLTYIIKLQEGVYWHLPSVDWEEGTYEWLKGEGPGGRHEFTADDYVFVWDMIQNNQVAGRIASLRNYFEAMESIEAIDDHTLKVTYNERLYTNLAMLMELWPMPRWLYMYDQDGNKYDDATWGLKLNEHWYNQKGIGVGPYKYKAWESGVKLEFEANEMYWGEPPSFERILRPVVKDQNAFPRKVKAGEIDITSIQPEQYKTVVLDADGEILGNEHIQTTKFPTLTYFYMGWNMDNPKFSDKRVRQAMTMSFDRQGIIDSVFHGLGTLHTGPFPKQVACYDQSIEPWPYDIERAKELLEEAGWTDTDGDGIRDKVIDGEKVDFEFTFLMYGSSTEYETLASIWRESLLEVGVKMTPSPVEWSTMLKKMDERDFEVYSGAWVPGWDTDLMQIWHSSEADKAQSSNRIGFRNEQADAIAEELRRTFDEDRRTELCHEFHALVHEEQPYTFFYARERPVLYWDTLNDPQFSLNWPYQDKRYWSFATEPER